MTLFITGVIMLASIIGLFWLKDRLRKTWLTRFVYSGLVARLAVVSAAFIALGILLTLAELIE